MMTILKTFWKSGSHAKLPIIIFRGRTYSRPSFTHARLSTTTLGVRTYLKRVLSKFIVFTYYNLDLDSFYQVILKNILYSHCKRISNKGHLHLKNR